MTNDTTTTKQRPTHTAFSVRKYKQNGAHKSSRTPLGLAGCTATARASISCWKRSRSTVA